MLQLQRSLPLHVFGVFFFQESCRRMEVSGQRHGTGGGTSQVSVKTGGGGGGCTKSKSIIDQLMGLKGEQDDCINM